MRFTNVLVKLLVFAALFNAQKKHVLKQALICAALGRLRLTCHYGNYLAASVFFNVCIISKSHAHPPIGDFMELRSNANLPCLVNLALKCLIRTCDQKLAIHWLLNYWCGKNNSIFSPVLQGELLTTSPTASVLLIPSRALWSPSVKCLLMWPDTTAQMMTMWTRCVGEFFCVFVRIITIMVSYNISHSDVLHRCAHSSLRCWTKPSESVFVRTWPAIWKELNCLFRNARYDLCFWSYEFLGHAN